MPISLRRPALSALAALAAALAPAALRAQALECPVDLYKPNQLAQATVFIQQAANRPEGEAGAKALRDAARLLQNEKPFGDNPMGLAFAKAQIFVLWLHQDTPPVEMAGEVLNGHSLDNRASVAALTVALRELQSKTHAWDVWAAASTQEEVGAKGALTSTIQLRPSLAIAVDVTFGKGPGANGWETFPLGKGITLGLGPNIHPFLHDRFKELADTLEIPCAVEPMPQSSGTDGMTMQLAAEGVPTMVLGIPLRYMHTPVEVVALKDIQRAGRLLAEFIGALEADFIEKIVWE